MNTKIRKHNYKKFAKSIMITKVIKITKLNQFRILVQPKLLQRYNRVLCFLQKWLQKESLFFPFLILNIKETFIILQKLRISLTNNRIKNNTYNIQDSKLWSLNNGWDLEENLEDNFSFNRFILQNVRISTLALTSF